MISLINNLSLCLMLMFQGVKPPQPQYGAYGSYSRQMTVYQNVRSIEAETQIREYRRFREEVQRNLPPSSVEIFVRRNNNYVNSRNNSCNARYRWADQTNRCMR